jgi:hypothetical protein
MISAPAVQSGGGTPLADFITAILQLIFHLLFPFVAVSLCGVSYVLANTLHQPEFGFWFLLGEIAFDLARDNTWVAVGLGIFVLAALPLAWVAYREQQVVISTTIMQWIIGASSVLGLFWLRTAWPYNGNGWQLFTYGILMFAAWAAVTEAALATLGIVAHIRASRPPKRKPPPQAPHGTRTDHRARREPETI